MDLPYSASPAPKVTWLFNGQPLVPSRRVTLDVIRNMTSACIGPLEMADAGTYTVTLENQFGKSTCSIGVKVSSKYGNVAIFSFRIDVFVTAIALRPNDIQFANHLQCRYLFPLSIPTVFFSFI